jgi:peptide/nickel transport system permease protein
VQNKILFTLIKRIAASIIVLFLMISFLFILLRLSPGDPVHKFISPELSPELAEKVKDSFKLNSSAFEQYKSFIINLARGDLGVSYNYRIPVLSVIKEFLPFTILLSGLSFIFQVLTAFILALISVKKINTGAERSISKMSLVLYALPSFVTGVLLIFLFSETIDLFPASGSRSFDHDSFSFAGKIMDYFTHLVLPLITLSLSGIALFYRYLRDNLEDIFNSTFVLNLRSNGVAEREIAWKHVIPNAVSPFIAAAGIELGVLLSGTLITEVIFGLPGMGRLTVNAIFARDYPLIVGCTLVAGILVILSNLCADLLKAKMDKRLLLKGILN